LSCSLELDMDNNRQSPDGYYDCGNAIAAKPRNAAVKYYPYSTFIILWLTKRSGNKDKSFVEVLL